MGAGSLTLRAAEVQEPHQEEDRCQGPPRGVDSRRPSRRAAAHCHDAAAEQQTLLLLFVRANAAGLGKKKKKKKKKKPTRGGFSGSRPGTLDSGSHFSPPLLTRVRGDPSP